MDFLTKFLDIFKEKELIAKKLIGSTEEEGELSEIINPYTKEVTTKYVKCSVEDAKRALNTAKKAFENTRKTPLHQRIALIEDVAKKLEERKEEFAKYITLEVAKPISQARIEVQRCIENLKICAAEIGFGTSSVIYFANSSFCSSNFFATSSISAILW